MCEDNELSTHFLTKVKLDKLSFEVKFRYKNVDALKVHTSSQARIYTQHGNCQRPVSTMYVNQHYVLHELTCESLSSIGRQSHAKNGEKTLAEGHSLGFGLDCKIKTNCFIPNY